MHCLGAVGGTSSSSVPSNGQGGNRGGVLSVVRALGVLVCEGRIQGPPRGYKEGPHCAAPLQATPNHHECDKDNYLCNRYLVLVKEIAERISIGSSLCVEVLMCNDCPCGLSTATSINPVSPIPSTLMTQWPHTSELLLEYWCIGVVPSKSSEMMNSQGLYQAVRSRLHFSQVAAWWSRSNGAKPTYVATRVVPYNADNLRKFRETPVEHTFPLASIGDNNSVKVTVWALPRMEDIPELKCPLHPVIDAKDDEYVARALTPTKNTNITHTTESSLVLPALLDDRLQTPCNRSGKHHCHCEEEEVSPPSPSIKPNGERKRRRSLPCGPPDTPASAHSLTSLSETTPSSTITTEQQQQQQQQEKKFDEGFESRTYINTGTLERFFWTQVSLDESEGNNEKRYKPSTDIVDKVEINASKNAEIKQELPKSQTSVPFEKKDGYRKFPQYPYSREPNLVINPLSERSSFHDLNAGPSTLRKESTSLPCTVHINYAKSNKKSPTERVACRIEKDEKYSPGDLSQLMSKLSFTKEGSKIVKEDGGIFDWISKVPGRVLNATPNNSTISTSNDKAQVLLSQSAEQLQPSDQQGKNCSAVKLKNCNLELSQREFDEVLAVLRSRTPSGRRRTPIKTLRKRERLEKLNEDVAADKKESCICPIHRESQKTLTVVDCECRSCKRSVQEADRRDRKFTEESGKCLQSVSNKADVLLGAILRTSRDRKGLTDISNGTRPRAVLSNEWNSAPKRDGERQASATEVPPDGRVIGQLDFEDDKFIPVALNKRLYRLKQLFKKEQEKKDTPVAKSPQENVDSGTSVKRKVDFSHFPISLKTEQPYQPLTDDATNLVHENLHANSTNYKFKDFNHHEASETSSTVSSASCDSKPRVENELKIDGVHEDIKKEVKDKRKVEKGDDEEIGESRVPSAIEQERFRRSLENAASMVFHSRTGLPLTSSPAPLRRGSCCFDYDSTLNTVSSKRSALFELNTPPSPGAVSLEETDREIDNSGEGDDPPKRSSSTRNRPQSHALLGSFEESALNGRLEPVSTVHGFTAEIGASGSFCPKHRKLPVTVFFYTLGDNDKVSSPYLAHINLGKKGYQVPRSGTIQVTLLNPLGTVVKMFVVLYDLSDMPSRSHTFLRQRTLRDKTLRYLIHLRFMSGKSGRIYLHTDIRMIICRKSDVDTASDFGSEPPKELRSYIHGPTNPKFSPRC